MDILKIKGADGQWHIVPVIQGGGGDSSIKSIGNGLQLIDGELSVDAATQVENSPKPITAAAVQVEIGNIEVLLSML